MFFDSKIEFDRQRAKNRLDYLIRKEKRFEITVKREIRSLKQNAYLHLILSWYAWEYGETLKFVKQEIFKKEINQDIFLTEHINRKTGEIREDWRSTKTLNSKEMTTAIDRFRDYSSKEAGIYLPVPEDLIYLNEIDRRLKIEEAEKYI